MAKRQKAMLPSAIMSSIISDHDLERLARLMMYGNEGDILEIVRLLLMDDGGCATSREAQHPDWSPRISTQAQNTAVSHNDPSAFVYWRH